MKTTGKSKLNVAELLRVVNLLTSRAPRHMREEVKTELLLHGLSLYESFDAGFVFVCLNNKKIDTVRRLTNVPVFEQVETMDDRPVERNNHGVYMLAVIDVYKEVTGSARRLLWQIVKSFYELDDPRIVKCIDAVGISRKRGFVILKALKGMLKTALQNRRQDALSDLREAFVLYESLREDVESGRDVRPRRPAKS